VLAGGHDKKLTPARHRTMRLSALVKPEVTEAEHHKGVVPIKQLSVGCCVWVVVICAHRRWTSSSG